LAGDRHAGLRLSHAAYDSFVVRVLSRPGAPAPLLGQVTHVATRRSAHFSTSQALVAFMEAHIGLPPEARSAVP
jgi:hypothetical protein